MEKIVQSLEDNKGLINDLRSAGGAPGLAYGVIHQGSIIHEDFSGVRDVQNELAPNRDTVFLIASLTKAMSATAVACLVEKHVLDWTTPIHQFLPELSEDSKLALVDLNVVDLLCHRTGKAWYDALYLQSNNRMMLPKNESLRTFDYIPQAAAPRVKYMYNNHAYNLVGFILERLGGLEYGALMKRELFDPLDMERTSTTQVDDGNVARPYNILADKTAFEIPPCETSDDTIMFAGQSVRSSLSDLLKFYGSFLTSITSAMTSRQSESSVERPTSESGILSRIRQLFVRDTSPASAVARAQGPFRPLPLKDPLPLVSTCISREQSSVYEQSYAMGWNRTQLPGELDFAWNRHFIDPFPKLGGTYPGKLAIWHGGNMPGSTAAVCLIPETQTAVVVLQNSLGLCDVADWTCQLLVDIIFAEKPMQDYVALASESVSVGVKRMDVVAAELDAERVPGTEARQLRAYTGKYYNSIKNWVIEILIDGDGDLCLRFQARIDEQYKLRHHHYDTFVWNLSYDDTVKRAQYCRPANYYKTIFESSSNGDAIDQLRWMHDPSIPEGEVFSK